MQKMILEYAQKLAGGGYAFGNRFFSLRDGLLVVEYDEDEYGYSGPTYYGTELVNGNLQTDEEGYVIFRPVRPVIDENTVWTLS